MTTSASLLGSVEQNNIVIGASRIFCAPYDTYIDEAVRFDTSFPPSPFLDLGKTENDASMNFTKEFYRYMIGLPKVLKDKKVISLDFSMSITLNEFHGANLARAIWNTNYAIKVFFSTPAIVVAAAVPVGNVVQMTSSTNYVEGQYIALASSSGGLVNSIDEYKIVEISGNFLILNRDVSTIFVSAPYVGMIKSWKLPFAGPKSNRIAIVLAFDNIVHEGQLLIAVPRAAIESNFSFGIPADSNAQIALNITGEAFVDLDISANSVATIIKFAS